MRDTGRIDWTKIPRAALQFEAEVPMITSKPGTEDEEDDPEFEMTLYSGASMPHPLFGEVTCDMASMSLDGATVGVHARHDLDRVVGAGFQLDVSGPVKLRGCLYRGEDEGAKVIRRLSAKKPYPYQASGMYVPERVVEVAEGEKVMVNGRELVGKMCDAIDVKTMKAVKVPSQVWYGVKVIEASVCPFGRDRNTSVSLAAEGAGTVDLSSALEPKEPVMDEKELKAACEKAVADAKAEWEKGQEAVIKAAVDKAVADALAAAAPKPATITELKAAFKDDPGFALEQAEKAATLEAARGAYADVLAARVKELQTKQARSTAPEFQASDEQQEEKAEEKKAEPGLFSEEQAKALMAAHPEVAAQFGADVKNIAAYARSVKAGRVEDAEFAALLD